MNFWNKKRVALLGGANLIGTHLARELVKRGALVLVADNLSVGKENNIPEGAHFMKSDLRDYRDAIDAVSGQEIVFHLAAQHGGRGYVSGGHDVELYDNLDLDATIFRACAKERVERVIFSSSACAYPIDLQGNSDDIVFLKEDMIDYKNIRQADGAYGTEKLVGELMLDAHIVRGLFKGCSTRSFTVYGELIGETHAIGALISKAFIKQDPFEIWGNGRSIRNWTHVDDNVSGALLAAERLDRGAINIGVEERITPLIAAQTIFSIVGWQPNEIKFLTDKPVGSNNRVADASKLKALGWKQEVPFGVGLRRTIEWYFETHRVEDVKENFERKLTEVV